MTSGAITWPKSERRRKPNGSERRSVESGPPVYWVFQFLLLVRADITLTSRRAHCLCRTSSRGAAFLQRLEGPVVLGTTMLRDNRDSGAERQLNAHNVLGEPLEFCSMRHDRVSSGRLLQYWARRCWQPYGLRCDDSRVSRFFKIARQRSFDSGAGSWFSGPETRRSLVFVCAPLAGGIRSKPSAPCCLARHARGCLVLLLTRRSQTPSRGFGLNRRTQSGISNR